VFPAVANFLTHDGAFARNSPGPDGQLDRDTTLGTLGNKEVPAGCDADNRGMVDHTPAVGTGPWIAWSCGGRVQGSDRAERVPVSGFDQPAAHIPHRLTAGLPWLTLDGKRLSGFMTGSLWGRLPLEFLRAGPGAPWVRAARSHAGSIPEARRQRLRQV